MDEKSQSNALEPRVVAKLDHKLLKNYADVRREEHELISKMIDTLARVDDLPEEQLEQVRDALFHTDYPFMMVLVGPFSAGKSSIINALLGEVVLEVGPIPTTDHIHILRYGDQVQKTRAGETTTVFHPNRLLENLSFVDTPGLESVFEKHDKVTRKFLHRADLLLMVMVATHVLSASNLNFLQELKAYGKRVIVLINQIDLLEEEDKEKVYNFVQEQARLYLGVEPIIWRASAKQALEAQLESPRDEILYDQSGFAEVEEYILETLNDITRVKQKLETPLQIVSNTRKAAAELVQSNQVALDEHRKTLKNIEAQITEATREQRRTIDTNLNEIDGFWGEAAMRGSEAIRELFQFSRAFGQLFSGLFEMIGIAGLLRRFGGRTRAQAAFDKHNVGEPLNKIPAAVDKLGARLEGRDVQDLDDLVKHTRAQVEGLPTNLRNKVIGTVQAPLGYDRSFLRRVRDDLDTILSDAARFETKRLDRQLTNMLIFMTLWEVIVLALALVFALPAVRDAQPGTVFLIFGVVLLLGLGGLALLPLRGMLLERAYSKRMHDLKDRYIEKLREPLTEMVNYGAQLRRDTVAPFTRLVESQNKLADELKNELDQAEQGLLRVQRGISALG